MLGNLFDISARNQVVVCNNLGSGAYSRFAIDKSLCNCKPYLFTVFVIRHGHLHSIDRKTILRENILLGEKRKNIFSIISLNPLSDTIHCVIFAKRSLAPSNKDTSYSYAFYSFRQYTLLPIKEFTHPNVCTWNLSDNTGGKNCNKYCLKSSGAEARCSVKQRFPGCRLRQGFKNFPIVLKYSG